MKLIKTITAMLICLSVILATLGTVLAAGCEHGDMTRMEGTPATCLKDGTMEYFHCNTCGRDFLASGSEIWSEDQLKTASNHSDKDSDGKCDFCGKNMPIFKPVANEGGIVYGGTYILVTEIGGKYYALTIPPEGEYGRGYEDFMLLCEIEKNEKGDFTFKTLEDNNVMMLTTGFCAVSGGDLDAGTPRYGFGTICGGIRYSLADYGNQNFYVESFGPAKYGYRIALNASGEALIGSVEQEWWSKPETADRGLLRAFDMTHEGKNTKFMSFYPESFYSDDEKYSGAEIASHKIYLYRMTNAGQTAGGITFATNDSNSTVSKGTFDELPDIVDLSNVQGIAASVKEDYITALIDEKAPEETSVIASVCTAIEATELVTEPGGTEATSMKYSVTPMVTVSDGEGNVIYTGEISNSNLSGAPITVTLYTGGVYPEQVIHYKKDGTKEYFYSGWSEKVTNEGAKSFEFDNNFVTISIDSFSEIEILKTAVSEDEPEADVAVNAIGIDASKYSVSGQTVTVTHDKACKAGYLDGEVYKAVAATKISDGKYSFAVPAGVEEVILVIKGDLNGDGNVNSADSTLIKRSLLPSSHAAHYAITKAESFASDLNGDGNVNSADSTLIRRSLLPASHAAYKAVEW